MYERFRTKRTLEQISISVHSLARVVGGSTDEKHNFGIHDDKKAMQRSILRFLGTFKPNLFRR